MRILVITTQFPLPARDGATRRIINLIKGLSVANEVVLCTQAGASPPDALINELKALCIDVHVIIHKRSAFQRLTQIALAPLREEPYLARVYWCNAFRERIEALMPTVDLVQAEFPYGAQYVLPGRTKVPRGAHRPILVLDAHNVETEILAHEAARGRTVFRRWFSRGQERKMQRLEEAICRHVDLVLATSDRDRDVLKHYNRHVVTVSNGTSIPPLRDGVRKADDTLTVMFTGLMGYRANIDAVTHFCADIWPKLRGPARRFDIVGKDPAPAVRKLAASDVKVLGEVPEVAPFLENADVFVAPLRIGSGTRIKILEAMSFGLPVVSTSIGCMGLDVEDGENILIADDPDAFAAATDRLLRSSELRAQIGARARARVAAQYSWSEIGRTLGETYGEIFKAHQIALANRPPVSLITTVFNEDQSIRDFLESVRAQTVQPQEIVIVDGGSSDRTVDIVRSFDGLPIRLICEPCNIARGRNIAIANARNEIIAVTDAGCRLDPRWVERITAFDASDDVIVGGFSPVVRSLFDACQFSLHGVMQVWMSDEKIVISSRSLAFRRAAFDAAGGYPEFLNHSEDEYFHLRLAELGYHLRPIPDALVYWDQRATLRELYRQFFLYMRGQGLGGLHPLRHAARYVVYGTAGTLAALSFVWPMLLLPLGAGVLVYAYGPMRNFRRLNHYPLGVRAIGMIITLLVTIDVAKLHGHLSGVIARWRRRVAVRSPAETAGES